MGLQRRRGPGHGVPGLGQGIRYFDTAPGYGNGLSEYRLGQALRQRDRRELVLSTKVGRVVTPKIDAPTVTASTSTSRRSSPTTTIPMTA